MIIRSLDNVNDWTFGKGKGNYLKDNAAIRQNIQEKLLSFLNDCFFDMDAGIDWFNILGGKSQNDINNAIYSQLGACYGVVEILDVQTTFYPETRIFNLSYSVKTIYDEDISETVELGGIYV